MSNIFRPSLLVSRTLPSCISVESEYVPVPVWEPHYPPVYKVQTGGLCSISCDSLFDNLMPKRYLIWIGSNQTKTFGATISGLIEKNLGPERCTLWDSKIRLSSSSSRYLSKAEIMSRWSS